MSYNILNDYIIKVPHNNPYNKPKLNNIRVIMSNNNLITNSKLLVPLINTSSSITGQYPSIIRAKKSVASFRVRKGGPIGLLTTLTPQKGFGFNQNRLVNYLNLLNIYYLPKISSTTPNNSKGFINNKLSLSNKTNSTLTVGVENYSLFSYISPLSVELLQISHNLNKLDSNKFTGGYTQISHNYRLPKVYFSHTNIESTTKFIHKFYYSLLYIPYTSN